MTPDHWGYVAAAWGLAAVVLGGYWRRLVRRERELRALAARRASAPGRPAGAAAAARTSP